MKKDKNLSQKVISSTDLNLNVWITLIKKHSKNVLFCSFCFPTDAIKNEFLENIEQYSDDFILQLLENFLWPAGHFGSDVRNFKYWCNLAKEEPKKAKVFVKQRRYYRCLLQDVLSNGRKPLFSGINWIVNLLPNFPKNAIQALNAYFLAYAHYLPDQRIHGLSDAMAVIRARYYKFKHSPEILKSIGWERFEYLIAYLFSKMGYKIVMTKKSYDGGQDIIAVRSEPGRKERNLIQCKNRKKNEGIKTLRELLGVVSDTKATKGTLITSAEFTPEAKKIAKSYRIDIVGQGDLQKLLNKYLGPKWSNSLDYYVNSAIKDFKLE